MLQFWYPARIDGQPDGDGYVVSFRDVPSALTGAPSQNASWGLAPDCLAVAIDGLLADGAPVPEPTPSEPGERLVPLDAPIAARVLLHRRMAQEGLSGRALAERLGKDEAIVRRMLAGKGASLNATLDALKALGVRATLAAA